MHHFSKRPECPLSMLQLPLLWQEGMGYCALFSALHLRHNTNGQHKSLKYDGVGEEGGKGVQEEVEGSRKNA